MAATFQTLNRYYNAETETIIIGQCTCGEDARAATGELPDQMLIHCKHGSHFWKHITLCPALQEIDGKTTTKKLLRATISTWKEIGSMPAEEHVPSLAPIVIDLGSSNSDPESPIALVTDQGEEDELQDDSVTGKSSIPIVLAEPEAEASTLTSWRRRLAVTSILKFVGTIYQYAHAALHVGASITLLIRAWTRGDVGGLVHALIPILNLFPKLAGLSAALQDFVVIDMLRAALPRPSENIQLHRNEHEFATVTPPVVNAARALERIAERRYDTRLQQQRRAGACVDIDVKSTRS